MQPIMNVPPLLTVRTAVWTQLFRENVLPWWAWPRAIVIAAFSLGFAPLRWWNRRTFEKKALNKPLERPPLFVLGHWRSGTTLLQTYLAQDPQMGILDGFQAFVPGLEWMDGAAVRRFLGVNTPGQRVQDQMPRGMEVPEEEEFAMGNLSLESAYHSFWFPQRNEYFERTILFPTLPDRRRWQQVYAQVVQRVAALTQKPQICLKNPANTARVAALLELYPDAKFVHIHRHPYAVYASMRHMLRVAVQPFALQDFTDEQQEERVFQWYRVVMQRYLAERDLIPAENRLELAYEEFERDPLEHLKEMYRSFKLPHFDDALPHLCAYQRSTRAYQKNRFELDMATRVRIQREWAFAFDAWSYAR